MTAPVSKPRPAPAPEKALRLRQRQRLIDACISALHLYGPSSTTIDKVVTIADMSPGIVNFYFETKAAMLVAALEFLAVEFEREVVAPVGALRHDPARALELLIDLYLDPDLASPRKVSVWYAFWGEANSRQEYHDICGKKDESFAALVQDLIGRLIAETGRRDLDADGVALGLVGALEVLWQDIAFRDEAEIDRPACKKRCRAFLRSVFPGRFGGAPPDHAVADSALFTAGRFARERDRLIFGSWQFGALENDMPNPGDYVAFALAGERILVVRDGSRVVRAFRNACIVRPHALVGDGSGCFAGPITCKADGITYRDDGERDGGPGLSPIDTACAGGIIFVRVDATRAAALPDPGPLGGGRFGPMAPGQIDVAADWTVLVEELLAARFVTRDGERLAELPGGLEWRAENTASHRLFLYPNLLIEADPEGTIVHIVPVAPGRSLVRTRHHNRAVAPWVERVIEIAESTQEGLIAPLHRRGRTAGSADEPSQHFRAWLADRA